MLLKNNMKKNLENNQVQTLNNQNKNTQNWVFFYFINFCLVVQQVLVRQFFEQNLFLMLKVLFFVVQVQQILNVLLLTPQMCLIVIAFFLLHFQQSLKDCYHQQRLLFLTSLLKTVHVQQVFLNSKDKQVHFP